MSSTEFKLLGDAGYTGTINDRRKQFFQDAGFENEYQYLSSLGYTGTVNDMRMRLAEANGVTMSQFILDGGYGFYGASDPIAVQGSTTYNGFLCNSSQVVTYSDTSYTHQTGDIAILAVSSDAPVDTNWAANTPTGYTLVADLHQADNYHANLGVFYKVLNAAETTVTVSPSGDSNTRGAITLHIISNVDTTTPMDVTPTTATAPNTARANPPSITPVTEGAVIMGFGASTSINSGAVYSSTDYDSFLAVGNTSNWMATLGTGIFAWTSGAFDAGAFTYSGSDNVGLCWAACSIALRPR